MFSRLDVAQRNFAFRACFRIFNSVFDEQFFAPVAVKIFLRLNRFGLGDYVSRFARPKTNFPMIFSAAVCASGSD